MLVGFQGVVFFVGVPSQTRLGYPRPGLSLLAPGECLISASVIMGKMSAR